MADKETFTTGKDHGKEPYVVNIEKMTVDNKNFRKTLWTGAHLQLTVMSIDVGDDIGLEVHPKNDQFLRVEKGKGRTEMGPTKNDLSFTKDVGDDDIVLVPAGTWHNVTNTGDEPLKVYVLYGPADHEPGTVHPEHKDAEKDPNEE
ncbi:cupin domain-containing protein [Ornithinimicrobium cryptoxanthini]|uniref:Cupin domain-containing protein n=1 Tax=Ornithinimicrobium cryptoxanthini TaxID=2934161 RepID=A0ABY4YJT4_9MICO|nr:cupin domain-containing protein [Ornithinimicrobium cryptoxanthini]USQ77047.1 cupin domain-containing protein [Ornithinimicrobium cryptoxanthini]